MSFLFFLVLDLRFLDDVPVLIFSSRFQGPWSDIWLELNLQHALPAGLATPSKHGTAYTTPLPGPEACELCEYLSSRAALRSMVLNKYRMGSEPVLMHVVAKVGGIMTKEGITNAHAVIYPSCDKNIAFSKKCVAWMIWLDDPKLCEVWQEVDRTDTCEKVSP